MKYVKLFENNSGYTAYTADTENFITPNVSYCIEEKEVYLHKRKPVATLFLVGMNIIAGLDETIRATVPTDYTGQLRMVLSSESGYYSEKYSQPTNGKARIVFEGLPAGSYRATGKCLGDVKYSPSIEASTTFKVSAN